jgi:general secretion pathway protein C
MKYLFVCIHLLLIGGMAFAGADLFYARILPDDLGEAGAPASWETAGPQPVREDSGRSAANRYQAVVSRNIFKVLTEETAAPAEKPAEPEKLAPTTLKLTLWGTVTGTSDVWAVIEDKAVRQQALYQVGDLVQGARVKDILRHQVILTVEGTDQVLEMETQRTGKPGPVSPGVPVHPSLSQTGTGDMPGSMLLEDAGEIMKQIKFRPYFSQGAPDGLMVYGIRPGSIFTQIGLRNGDIIKEVNGMPITTAADGMGMLAEIQGSEDIGMVVIRRGKPVDLSFPSVAADSPVEADNPMDEDRSLEAAPGPDSRVMEAGEEASRDMDTQQMNTGDQS